MAPADNTISGGHELQFGSALIQFEVSYGARKRLKISVHPDLRVTVEAPEDKPLDDILARVRRRADWIVKQLDYFNRFQPLPTPRTYIGGETHVYLGRQYRLKIICDGREQVKLIRGYLEVYTKQCHDSNRVRILVQRWFHEHGKTVILGRLVRCYESVQRFGLPQPKEILFRRMEKRWGSCGKSGSIILNRELAKAPVHCIDYVIIHELCHLRYPNHSKEFFKLLALCLPDWEKRKERLEHVVI